MALFSDFFPSATAVPGTFVNTRLYDISRLGQIDANGNAIATAVNAVLTGDNSDIMVGDTASWTTAAGRMLSGTVQILIGTNIIFVRFSPEATQLAQTQIEVRFIRNGQDVIMGELIVAGDLGVTGDAQLMGDTIVIGNDGLPIAPATAIIETTTTIASRSLLLPGVTDGTIAAGKVIGLDASGEVVSDLVDSTHIAPLGVATANIALLAVDSAQLANDSVSAIKINADVAGTGLAQNATTGALEVAATAAGAGLVLNGTSGAIDVGASATTSGISVTADAIAVRVGGGLSIDSTNTIVIDSLNINDTLVFATTNVGVTTPASALTAFVAAFNAATADIDGVNLGFTVPAAQTIDRGDLVLITHGQTGATITESYIYTGATVTAPADVLATDFADITHAGQVVESITSVTNGGITYSASVGNVTAGIDLADMNSNLALGATGLALATNVDVVGTLDVTLATTLDTTLAVTGVSTLTGGIVSSGAVTLSNADINITGLGARTTTEFLALDAMGNLSAQAVNVGTSIGLGNLTVGTLPVAAASSMLANSLISQAPAAAPTSVTIGGTAAPIVSALIDATATANRSVVVDALGRLTAGVAPTAGVGRLTIQVATNANTTVSAVGSLVVLPIIATANRVLTLPTTRVGGDVVRVSNLSAVDPGSGAFRWEIDPGVDKIMNTTVTGTFLLDDSTASFDLVYVNAAIGWVIIGAN